MPWLESFHYVPTKTRRREEPTQDMRSPADLDGVKELWIDLDVTDRCVCQW